MAGTPRTFYNWESPDVFGMPSPACPINISRDHYSSTPLLMHAHDFLEIAIISGGEGVYQTPDATFEIKRGDVFMIPLGALHRYGPPSQLEVCNVLLRNNDVLKKFPELLGEPALQCFLNLEPRFRAKDRFRNHLSLNEEELELLMSFWRIMYSENKTRSRDYENIIWSLLHCFFIQICRFYDKYAEAGRNSLYGLAKVLRYIEENYSEPISIETLVQLSGYKRKAFTAKFVQATEHLPREYILLFRLEKAREMLRSQKFSAKEVAVNCGFCDPSYFGQQYLKHFHTTPFADRFENAEEKDVSLVSDSPKS